MDDRHARFRRSDTDRRRRPTDGHRSLGRARFERLVVDAASGLSPALRGRLDSVHLDVQDVPPTAGALSRFDPDAIRTADGRTVDRLTLYRRPLELRATSKLDLIELLGQTLARQLTERFGPEVDDESW